MHRASKTATAAVAIFALAFPAPVSAAPAAKLGAKCAFVGKTAKSGSTKLVCAKRRGALVWTKAPAPKPSSPTQSVPPVVTLSTTAENAFRAITSAAAAAPKASAALDVRRSPNATGPWVEWTVTNLALAVNLWAPQYLPSSPLPQLFFTEKDREWFEQQLRVEQFAERDIAAQLKQFDDFLGNNMTWAGATGSDGHVLNTYTRLTTNTDVDRDYGVRQGPPHEWTHMAQMIYRDKMPCWFTEGSAMFYGIVLASTDATDFWAMRLQLIGDRFNGSTRAFIADIPSGGWPAWLEANDVDYDHSKCGPNGAYAVGAVLTEYLVSLKGHQGVVDFMTKTGMDGYTWQSAMVEVFGLSHEQWLAKADAYLRDVQQQVGS
jgi:hypothetical protein